jgi:hypothetical protein
MFTLVGSQRKRREIDPILHTLRRCREELSASASREGPAQERFRRINELLNFLVLMENLAQRVFQSHRGLRAAVELLAQPEEE